MMSKKIFSRASLVCGASCIVIACALVGCGKGDAENAAAPASAPSPAKDAKLKQQLRGQISERDVLQRARATIAEKMEAVAAKYDGDLKKAANDPEMVSLIQRARDIETNLSSNRTHSAEMIRAAAAKHAAQKGADHTNDLQKEVK